MEKLKNWLDLESRVKKGEKVYWTNLNYKVIYKNIGGDDYFYIVSQSNGHMIGIYKPDMKINDFFIETKINGTMKKLKKGSKEAKEFMARLRASRSSAKKKTASKKKASPKKRKINGDKHTDSKSYNYKINISGLDNERNDVLTSIKQELARISMLKLRIDVCKRAIENNKKDKNEVLRLKNVIKEAKLFIIVHKKNIMYLKKLIK